MMLVDKETGKGYVEMEKVHHDKKEYASKGVAGTALGLGIAGTALALFNNGFGGNLFGCRGAAADGAVAAASIANERYLERKVSLNSVFLDLILKISGGNLFVKIGYRHCFYNGRIDNIIYLSYY